MRTRTIVAAMCFTACAAGPAAAQDVRVRVQVDLGSEFRSTIRDMVAELTATARDWRDTSAQRDTLRVEQSDHETRTLAIGSTGSLELKNIVGEITVTAGGGRDATLEIIRRSRGRTADDAKAGLDRVKVVVDQRGDRVDVRPLYPTDSRGAYSVSTSYHITAPAGTNVTASSLSGAVTIAGIRGDLAVSVTSGDIDISGAARISMAKAASGTIRVSGADMPDGTLTLSALSGNVTVLDSRVHRLEAKAISGDVVARGITAAAGVVLTSSSGVVEYGGTLSRNGRYELQSHSGAVHFVPTSGVGFELQANTFSGDIRTDVPVQLQGPVSGRGARRSIRGTVGDGGAIVVLTTFSGSIAVGKR